MEDTDVAADSGSWPTVKRAESGGFGAGTTALWLEVVTVWTALGCCEVEIAVGDVRAAERVESESLAGVVRGSLGVDVRVVVDPRVGPGVGVVRKRRRAA